METIKENEFKKGLTKLINILSLEDNSNTPDFLLADYLFHCLILFNVTTCKRDDWHQFKPMDKNINECKEI